MENITEYRVAVQLWRSVPPILIVVGTAANIMSVAVLTRKALKNSNTAFYLTALAFVDTAVLYGGPLRFWILKTFEVDISALSHFSCKFHVFMTYFSLDLTSWILVAVTLDRCILVCLPFHAKKWCTLKIAYRAITLIIILAFLANLHIFWTLGIRFHHGRPECMRLYGFNFSVFPWIDFTLYCFVPFSIMIICNICIIRQLLKKVRKFRINPLSGRQYNASRVNKDKSCVLKKNPQKIPGVTVTLLTVNGLFLVMTLPVVVFEIGYTYWYSETTPQQEAQVEVVWAISNLLQYTNNAIHFFLYCLTGPRFRRECLALFRCKRTSDIPSISNIS